MDNYFASSQSYIDRNIINNYYGEPKDYLNYLINNKVYNNDLRFNDKIELIINNGENSKLVICILNDMIGDTSGDKYMQDFINSPEIIKDIIINLFQLSEKNIFNFKLSEKITNTIISFLNYIFHGDSNSKIAINIFDIFDNIEINYKSIKILFSYSFDYSINLPNNFDDNIEFLYDMNLDLISFDNNYKKLLEIFQFILKNHNEDLLKLIQSKLGEKNIKYISDYLLSFCISYCDNEYLLLFIELFTKYIKFSINHILFLSKNNRTRYLKKILKLYLEINKDNLLITSHDNSDSDDFSEIVPKLYINALDNWKDYTDTSMIDYLDSLGLDNNFTNNDIVQMPIRDLHDLSMYIRRNANCCLLNRLIYHVNFLNLDKTYINHLILSKYSDVSGYSDKESSYSGKLINYSPIVEMLILTTIVSFNIDKIKYIFELLEKHFRFLSNFFDEILLTINKLILISNPKMLNIIPKIIVTLSDIYQMNLYNDNISDISGSIELSIDYLHNILSNVKFLSNKQKNILNGYMRFHPNGLYMNKCFKDFQFDLIKNISHYYVEYYFKDNSIYKKIEMYKFGNKDDNLFSENEIDKLLLLFDIKSYDKLVDILS